MAANAAAANQGFRHLSVVLGKSEFRAQGQHFSMPKAPGGLAANAAHADRLQVELHVRGIRKATPATFNFELTAVAAQEELSVWAPRPKETWPTNNEVQAQALLRLPTL